MSNSLAIAAVTSTLQAILQTGVDTELAGTKVTILPLDKARNGNTDNQVNLFLYQVARNAAWANRDMQRQVQPGETGFPPLPLNLYYLVTAFGKDNDVSLPFGHVLLGKAMSILHDHPVLSAQDIKAVISGALPPLPLSDLDRQIERIRITLHPITVDELSKLWTGFATQYRLSAAYEVAVALIESTRAARTPLPVLTRGPGDSGVASQGDLTPPLPTLETVTPASKQPSARLGEVLTLTGFHLDGASIRVRFQHPLWSMPVDVTAPGGTAEAVSVQIPNDAANWPAGFYSVAVVLQRAGENFDRSTNELPLALAPSITINPPADAPPNIVLTVGIAPEVRPEQRVSLLMGDREIPADPHPTQVNSLTFASAKPPAGDYYVRLRVDGIDSLLVNRAASPPVFDSKQKVTVT